MLKRKYFTVEEVLDQIWDDEDKQKEVQTLGDEQQSCAGLENGYDGNDDFVNQDSGDESGAEEEPLYTVVKMKRRN